MATVEEEDRLFIVWNLATNQPISKWLTEEDASYAAAQFNGQGYLNSYLHAGQMAVVVTGEEARSIVH